MKNKFLKMTFMALCLSTSSVVHAMDEEGDEQSIHSPVLLAGEYEISKARGLPKYGDITIHQFDNDRLALQVKLSPETPHSEEEEEDYFLQPLHKLGESNSPDNLVVLFCNDEPSSSQVTKYYGKKTVDDCNMEFEFEVINTPNPLRAPGEKGLVLSVVFFDMPPPPITDPSEAYLRNLAKEMGLVDPYKFTPGIRFCLFKKADDQPPAQGPHFPQSFNDDGLAGA
ncbi:MAG: hypothetical protein K2Y08_05390 [Alphaproteobacteria bacterium]|nr:hypothetical protein [Alphaproteobacteria bacterium]